MIKNLLICISILCLISTAVSAQLSDLVRFEYVGLPENSNGGTSFSRYRGLINYPIELKKKDAYFIIGADYRFIRFNVDESLLSFESEELSEFKQLSLSFGYTYKMNEDWRFGAQIQPGFSTNLDIFDISFNEAVISGTVVFIKDKKKDEHIKKPYRLIVGISVSGNGGFPVLPFISYYRKFHPKWSYNLGVPKTQLQYHFSDRHRFKAVVRIDGFSSNLQNNIITEPGTEGAERFRQRLLVGGGRYEYKLSKHIEFYFNGSYIFDNSIELRDESRNTIFEFQEDSRFYIKTGLRFKI